VPGEWYTPGTGPGRPRKRPRWLIPAGAAAAIVVIVVALVLALGSGSGRNNTAQTGSGTTPAQSHSASASASGTPHVGDLQLAQLQVGDCLTGADLQLNKNTPWPKLSHAVPCSQGHTAEVFVSNNSFWSKNGPYPGYDKVTQAGRAACNSAFQSYVGIPYSKSIYSWTFILPTASSWPQGDRSLHCIAYYATTAVPSGQTMHSSIKGAAQ
jgi:hypothetical protein